jgi:hypothetical protein
MGLLPFGLGEQLEGVAQSFGVASVLDTLLEKIDDTAKQRLVFVFVDLHVG